MTSTPALANETINAWADDLTGPVALYLKQRLLPVEGEGGVIFPPTYADLGYNIDTLSDGTKVATIDSVGSQANRMEPIFKQAPYSELVPQIEIAIHTKDEDDGKKKYVEKRSILDLAHRSADAVVHSSPTLSADMAKAFTALKRRGDAKPLCLLAPTSLLFGVWDSRGGSGEKRPRLVRSVIRAWNIEPLYAAAQFNSIWKSLDEDQQKALEAEAKAKKTKLSEKGFADAPATFRKVSTAAAAKMTEYRDGSPNPERRVLGGVIANGRIERDITINLVALRAINGENGESSQQIRRYLLSLALIAATANIELFLREGCHLRFADERDTWVKVPRRGSPEAIDLSSNDVHNILLAYARNAVKPFSGKWPQSDKLIHKFDLKAAKQLLAKKGMDEPASE